MTWDRYKNIFNATQLKNLKVYQTEASVFLLMREIFVYHTIHNETMQCTFVCKRRFATLIHIAIPLNFYVKEPDSKIILYGSFGVENADTGH